MSKKQKATIAVIGGSGLYEMEGMTGTEPVDVDTPFGKPSDSIIVGDLDGVTVAFLPRHGRGHRFNPSHIPARANIYALKSLGVERIISVSAVGSLKEEFAPLDLVIPSQLIDRTRLRENTFFDTDVVVHVAMADPFCHHTSQVIHTAARHLDITVNPGGTMVVMEGPAFSTRAESFMYRSWGADIIGMTALPEAKLAREAEICYATMAWITDYDCWHQGAESVTVEMVIANLQKNVATSKALLKEVIPALGGKRDCPCESALRDAIITPKEQISDDHMPRQDPGEPYFRVDSAEGQSMLAADPNGTIVIDVRRDDEWVTGHVAGAIHIPVDDLTDNMDRIPTDKKVLFICAAGVRSGLACEMAAAMGYEAENLYNIEDGTPAWIAGGHPTSYGDDA